MKERNAFSTVQLLIFFNLLLALIALLKDVLLAGFFGTSKIADAINLAFFIPDTIGNSLIGSALLVATIPIFTKLALGEDNSVYHAAVQRITTAVFIGTFVIWVGMLLFSTPLFHLFHETNEEYIKNYFFLMAPIIVIAPLWLLGSAILQASKQFILPAVTPVIYNLLLLAVLFFCHSAGLEQVQGGRLFSLAITTAAMIVGAVTWFYIWKNHKLKWVFRKKQLPELTKMGTVFTAYLFILLFGQAALFCERLFASSLENGTISALSYAYRISQFPLWVFIAAINTFILPRISIHVMKKDLTSLKRDLTKSFIFVIIMAALLSLFLVIFSEPLIKIVLARGSFDLQSVKLTSTIVKSYCLSIVGQSLYVFCTRFYVAEGKMKIPFIIGLAGSILNIGLLKFFVPLAGAAGIGYAAAIASTFNGVSILLSLYINLFSAAERGEVTYE